MARAEIGPLDSQAAPATGGGSPTGSDPHPTAVSTLAGTRSTCVAATRLTSSPRAAQRTCSGWASRPPGSASVGATGRSGSGRTARDPGPRDRLDDRGLERARHRGRRSGRTDLAVRVRRRRPSATSLSRWRIWPWPRRTTKGLVVQESSVRATTQVARGPGRCYPGRRRSPDAGSRACDRTSSRAQVISLVTMRLLDDVDRYATMGTAFAGSTDGGRHWARPRAVNDVRWHPTGPRRRRQWCWAPRTRGGDSRRRRPSGVRRCSPRRSIRSW